MAALGVWLFLSAAASAPGPQDHLTSLYLFDAKGARAQRFAGVPVDRPRLADEAEPAGAPTSWPLSQRTTSNESENENET